MGVNSFASANSLPSDTPHCLITVYYTIRAFKTVKNIQHAFSLCNVVRVEEHAGGGGGLSDNICQLWPSFTTRIKLTIKNLEGPPPRETDIILLSIVAIVYICNIYSYSVLDEQYTPWVLLAVRSNAKCLDHVDTNKTGQKFTVTRGCVTACHSFGRRPLIFLWYVTIDWL